MLLHQILFQTRFLHKMICKIQSWNGNEAPNPSPPAGVLRAFPYSNCRAAESHQLQWGQILILPRWKSKTRSLKSDQSQTDFPFWPWPQISPTQFHHLSTKSCFSEFLPVLTSLFIPKLKYIKAITYSAALFFPFKITIFKILGWFLSLWLQLNFLLAQGD